MSPATIAGDTYPDTQAPEKTISEHMYGERLHWGDKAEALEAHASDEFWKASARLEYMTAAAGLSHLYMGFAVIVQRVLGAA